MGAQPGGGCWGSAETPDGSVPDRPASPCRGRGRQGLRVLRPTVLPQTFQKPGKLEPPGLGVRVQASQESLEHWPLSSAVLLSTSCPQRAPARASAPPTPLPHPHLLAAPWPRASPASPAGSSDCFSPPPAPGEATSDLRAASPHLTKLKLALSPGLFPVAGVTRAVPSGASSADGAPRSSCFVQSRALVPGTELSLAYGPCLASAPANTDGGRVGRQIGHVPPGGGGITQPEPAWVWGPGRWAPLPQAIQSPT